MKKIENIMLKVLVAIMRLNLKIISSVSGWFRYGK